MEFRGEFDYNTVQWWYSMDGDKWWLEFYLWIDEESLPSDKDWDYPFHLDDECVTLHIMRSNK